VADGGDGYRMLATSPRVDTGVLDLDAVIAYLQVLRQPVGAPAEARFRVESR